MQGRIPAFHCRVTGSACTGDFAIPDLDWDELFQRFIDKKVQVFELLDSTPGLTRRAQKSTRKFLNEFYEILDSPKLRQKNIVDACRTILEVD